MLKKPLTIAISSVLGLSTVAATGAFAEEAANNNDIREEIVTTGSRISRSELSAPTPLQVLDSVDIELVAQTNIGDLINQLPSAGQPLFNRTNSNFDNNNSGVVNIDYRDLGIARTLTLVNGRRFVAGVPGSSAVDLNAIPSAMIERVEVITGGASAVYGSDAVAGVVNFILKDDFEGVELNTRYQSTTEGDGQETVVDLLLGSNFDNDKGNAVFQISYTDQNAVFSRDRDATAIDAVSSVFFGGEPFEQTTPFLSSFPPQGRFDVSGTGSSADDFTFLPDGTLVDSFFTNGNDAMGRAPNGFNRSAFRTIAIPTERFLLSSNINYNFNDNVTAFFEGTYSNVTTQSRLEPFPLASDDIFTVGSGGLPLQYEDRAGNMINNPFLPQAIIDAATANGVDNIFFTRRLAEFGPRGSGNERQTFRGVIGLEGTIEDTSMRWDVSYNYGQSTQAQFSEGQIDVTSFRNALLSEVDPDTGAIRCVDVFAEADGCVPINIFGFNSVTQDALNYITAEQSRSARVTQSVFQANLTGTLTELPAGEMQFAVGYEYRKETSDARNDALTVRGLNSSNAIASVIGSFDVNEVYAELDIPIVNDGFVDYIGLGLAGRVSDYSTVGNTSTYEARLEVRPTENLTFRGSFARAVRAPNIDELFDPGGQTFAQVTDPCAGVTAATTGVVADNCRSIPEIAQRIADTGAFTLTQSELQGTSGFLGGNPNLEEEEADTYTVGFVYTPDFLPDSLNASLTLDYFDIDVEGAIVALDRTTVLNLCFDSPGLNNPLCSNVRRFDSTSPFAGALDEVDSTNDNIGSIVTSGVDVGFNLDFDLDSWSLPGSLGVSTVYTYLDDYVISTSLPDDAPDVEVGEIGNAEHRWNTSLRYTTDDLMVQLRVRYIGESRIEDQDLSDEDCASLQCFVDEVVYTDLQARYTFEDSPFGENLEVFAGFNNLFDEDAPIIPAGLTDSDTGTETNAGVYDAIGRSYYVGVKVNF
ncbi:TonB-dependent receptor [bacterium SCSIO 12696]|nr:TonB-dependent receptor [bacterium SCSIO 12696]